MEVTCGSIALAGIARDCSSSNGGIRVVYLARYEDVATVATTEGKISAVTLAESAKWYKYQFRKNTGSLTSTYTAGSTEGDYYIQSDLAMIFNRMDTPKRIEMQALTQGEVVAVVEDANGKAWFVGKDAYLSPTAGTGETGTAVGDQNAYTITLSTQSQEYPYELTEEAYAAVKESAA